MTKLMLRSALLTILTLFGGLLLGLLAGSLIFELIPGSSVDDPQLGHAGIAAVPALAGFLTCGAAWGVQIGRLAGADDSRRMAWAGLLGFGPITIALALLLGLAEPTQVERLGAAGQPIHRVFTLLFTPSAFLIAGVSVWALGRGLRQPVLARSLFWRVGLAAAITFLVVNLTMEAAGWVVGAPGAAQCATMLVVMFSGNLAAALVGGGMVGWLLARR